MKIIYVITAPVRALDEAVAGVSPFAQLTMDIKKNINTAAVAATVLTFFFNAVFLCSYLNSLHPDRLVLTREHVCGFSKLYRLYRNCIRSRHYLVIGNDRKARYISLYKIVHS